MHAVPKARAEVALLIIGLRARDFARLDQRIEARGVPSKGMAPP
jgi:hypothetical protein